MSFQKRSSPHQSFSGGSSSKARQRACMNCGMQVSSEGNCPKCDAVIASQTDGSTITEDIAHNGERVHEALNKLDELVQEAKAGRTQQICLITGGGSIRQEVIYRLGDYRFRKEIRSFDADGPNPGVIMVQVR